ncbi:MAG: hypothetical protein RMY34_34175 [Aulosira sp. DedQUE10]|nr:hypothetical protein [Aulosira sp. DedQUE10]
MSGSPLVKKILVLAANPKNSSELRLGEEVREIEEGLRLSRYREQFKLVSKWAVRARDFHRYMLDIQPQIVHFSGRGIGENGIVLEDDAGKAQLVSTDALESLFKIFASKGVEYVLLNACYSEVQAEAISKHIAYVIGMTKEIGDTAAITFAVAFYDALGAGETVEFAFELGRSAIQIAGIAENLTPVLKKNPNLSQQPIYFQSSGALTASQRFRLERKRDELQEEYELLSRKLSRLRQARNIETDTAVKLKLDVQIEETQKEVDRVESQLNQIEWQFR